MVRFPAAGAVGDQVKLRGLGLGRTQTRTRSDRESLMGKVRFPGR